MPSLTVHTTVGNLICTFISEDQGLDKSRSVSNLKKISVCHLEFFQIYSFFLGGDFEKIQVLQSTSFHFSGCRLNGRWIRLWSINRSQGYRTTSTYCLEPRRSLTLDRKNIDQNAAILECTLSIYSSVHTGDIEGCEKALRRQKLFYTAFAFCHFHLYIPIYIFFLFFSYSKKPNGWSSSMQWSQGNACNLCTFNSADQWDNWSCTYIALTPSFELQKKNGLSPSLDMLIQETRLSQIRGN